MIEIALDESSDAPLYLQLTDAVESAVREGRLRPGDRLPSEAELAATLAINPYTISRGYAELAKRGVVTQRRGVGTRVTPDAPKALGGVCAGKLRSITLVTGVENLSDVCTVNRFTFLDLIAGASAAARANSIEIRLEPSLPELPPPGRSEEVGFLILGSQGANSTPDIQWTAEARRRNVPVATVGGLQPSPGIPHVTCSRYDAIEIACKHLVSCGYRSIGFIGELYSLRNSPYGKLACFMAALYEAGIDISVKHIVNASFVPGQPHIAANKLFDAQPLPEAVFVDTDYKAMEVINAFRAKGVRVPDDIGVIGYDGLDEGRHFHPPLTTVSIPRFDLSWRAVELLMGWSENGEVPENINIAPALVEGETTKRLERF